MAINFRYKARDKHGKAVSGTMSGEDKSAVARHLSTMGYIPIAVEELKQRAIAIPKFLERFYKKVTLEELNIFTRQLLTLERSGIPLLAGLSVLEKQTENKYFKDVIKEIVSHVEGGSSLSEAMGKYSHIFSDLYVNMIKAGEASGLLDEILQRLVEFGDKEIENVSRIKMATRYPIFVLAALAGAFAIVVTYVIPKFAAIFSQFKTALPLPTRILLNLSFIIRSYWYIILLGIGIVIYLFYQYINTREGRFKWDSLKLKIPVFGRLISMLVMSRFSRTMSILLRSGLPILQVLDMVSRTVGNTVISRTVETIATSVREGKGISGPMAVSGLFPPIVVQMVAIGEETGKVDELLMRVSEYYDQQSDYMMKNLTVMIEPIFVMILGVMVLIMALAIFLPMWNMVTLFQH